MAGLKANPTTISISDFPVTGVFFQIGCPTSISSSSSTSDITTSCLGSVAVETVSGLPDTGTIALEINLLSADIGQDELRTAFENGELRDFEIVLSDTTTLAFSGNTLSYDLSVAVDSIVTISTSIKLSGVIVWS